MCYETKYLLQKKYIRKRCQNNKKMTPIVSFFTLSHACQIYMMVNYTLKRRLSL